MSDFFAKVTFFAEAYSLILPDIAQVAALKPAFPL
jgi:hypothetical protein